MSQEPRINVSRMYRATPMSRTIVDMSSHIKFIMDKLSPIVDYPGAVQLVKDVMSDYLGGQLSSERYRQMSELDAMMANIRLVLMGSKYQEQDVEGAVKLFLYDINFIVDLILTQIKVDARLRWPEDEVDKLSFLVTWLNDRLVALDRLDLKPFQQAYKSRDYDPEVVLSKNGGPENLKAVFPDGSKEINPERIPEGCYVLSGEPNSVSFLRYEVEQAQRAFGYAAMPGIYRVVWGTHGHVTWPLNEAGEPLVPIAVLEGVTG